MIVQSETISPSQLRDKLDSLRSLFGTDDVSVEADALNVMGRRYPVVDGVIILLDPSQYSKRLHAILAERSGGGAADPAAFAEDIQYTFGVQWEKFSDFLPEHEAEFRNYFDEVNLEALRGKRICDFGCGSGRWAAFLQNIAGEMVMLDFSDAIFTAKRNFEHADNMLFFMADVTRLPFADDAFDFGYCLGVLHHLPIPALPAVRSLSRYAPILLIYLYYALDNRPRHYRVLFRFATAVRVVVSKVRNGRLRIVLTEFMLWTLYLPLIGLGYVFDLFGGGRYVPLYEGYAGNSLSRIRQDVYDRFFTGIERRVTRAEIMTLTDTFSEVVISKSIPYWHFVCRR